MVGYLRVLALDYDGTLTHDGRRPDDDVLDALRDARDAGLTVLLVTGRILLELQESFPDVADHVDLIVAENGCVLGGPQGAATPRRSGRRGAAERVARARGVRPQGRGTAGREC